jgi:hypothetical protein
MRENLYRGKCVDNDQWVYGYLYITHTGEYEISCYNKELDIERYTYVVKSETVGRYIDRTDKNGIKIFTHDIVRCYGGEYCQGYWEYDSKFKVESAYDIITILESEYVEVISQ